VDRAIAAMLTAEGQLHSPAGTAGVAGPDAAPDATGGSKDAHHQPDQKVLEDANIKLASVASDVMGVSGRAMIQRLIEGETDPYKLADLAQRQLLGRFPSWRKLWKGS
jgi:hypothetical protein